MVRNEEVKIYTINPDKEENEKTKDDVVVYALAGYGVSKDTLGKLTIADDTVKDRYIGAKSIGRRYFVKLSVTKEPYDPTKFNEMSERNNQIFAGRNMFSFKEVGKPVFDSYLNFLRSKNPVHLEHVKRGLI